jgi:hypothetical protein
MTPAPAATTVPTAERRSAPRRQPAVNTVYRIDAPDGGPQAIALVWNISTTGISVLVPEPRQPGTVLTGYLDTMEGEHLRPLTLRVIHCKPLETGDYALGARFEHPLTEEELKPFVSDV